MEKVLYPRTRQFLQFVLVGGVATLTQYAFLFIALKAVDAGVATLSGISYLVGSLVAYTLNYNFTFSNSQAHHKILPKFYAMVFMGWLLTAATMKIFVDYVGLNTWISQAITTVLVLGWNFLMSRVYVFKENS